MFSDTRAIQHHRAYRDASSVTSRSTAYIQRHGLIAGTFALMPCRAHHTKSPHVSITQTIVCVTRTRWMHAARCSMLSDDSPWLSNCLYVTRRRARR